MELLKHINNFVRPYVRMNELLDEINIKGLDADFVEIYKNIKAAGVINLMPSQLFKYIEDIAQNELVPISYEIGEGLVHRRVSDKTLREMYGYAELYGGN